MARISTRNRRAKRQELRTAQVTSRLRAELQGERTRADMARRDLEHFRRHREQVRLGDLPRLVQERLAVLLAHELVEGQRKWADQWMSDNRELALRMGLRTPAEVMEFAEGYREREAFKPIVSVHFNLERAFVQVRVHVPALDVWAAVPEREFANTAA